MQRHSPWQSIFNSFKALEENVRLNAKLKEFVHNFDFLKFSIKSKTIDAKSFFLAVDN